MNINFSKKIILRSLVLLWIVFSIVYIIWDVWSDFKVDKLNQAYQQGRTDTVNAVMTEAEKCQVFSIFSAEKQIQLKNVDCQQNTTQ